MTSLTTIYCDECAGDLTVTANEVAYMLVLTAKGIDRDRELTCSTGFHVEPPIKATKHFCDLECLALWIKHYK